MRKKGKKKDTWPSQTGIPSHDIVRSASSSARFSTVSAESYEGEEEEGAADKKGLVFLCRRPTFGSSEIKRPSLLFRRSSAILLSPAQSSRQTRFLHWCQAVCALVCERV